MAPTATNEDLEVRIWRQEQLEKVGCPRKLAYLIAHADVDLHQAVGMFENGCPPDLARAILVPDPDPEGGLP